MSAVGEEPWFDITTVQAVEKLPAALSMTATSAEPPFVSQPPPVTTMPSGHCATEVPAHESGGPPPQSWTVLPSTCVMVNPGVALRTFFVRLERSFSATLPFLMSFPVNSFAAVAAPPNTANSATAATATVPMRRLMRPSFSRGPSGGVTRRAHGRRVGGEVTGRGEREATRADAPGGARRVRAPGQRAAAAPAATLPGVQCATAKKSPSASPSLTMITTQPVPSTVDELSSTELGAGGPSSDS